MKIHVASDLHLEFMPQEYENEFWMRLENRAATEEPDALVLAGDIGNLKSDALFEALEYLCTLYPKVFYTPGNHEYFGTTVVDGNERLARGVPKESPLWNRLNRLTGQGTHYLRDYTVRGGTLWYPEPPDFEEAQQYWIDYRAIGDGAVEIHREHRAFVADCADGPADIMVSHHLPSAESIGHRWQGYSTNCFFHAQIDGVLEKWQQDGKAPRLWVHGHTHDPKDYISRFGFRVYCNPLGYPREGMNPGFWDRLLVDI